MITQNFQKFVFLICLYGLFSTTASAQTVREYADIDSLQVGDTFEYSITLNRSQQYDEIGFPDSTNFGDTFEIRSRQQYQVSTYKDSIAYELQFFGTSDTAIAQLPVRLIQQQDTTTLYTNPVVVPFSSVLAEEEQSFRPLKPIYEFAVAWWPYILGFLILLIAAYYFYKYYWSEQEKKEPTEQKEFSPTPFVNPIKELRKAIRSLENKELSSREDFEEFYIELGDAIRRYFEQLHNIPALESTSHEILTMLRNRAIDKSLITDTRIVLQEADMVKFAKFAPTKEQANRALEKAENFLARANEVDGPRVDHLRRKHHAWIEEERERFNQQNEEVEA